MVHRHYQKILARFFLHFDAITFTCTHILPLRMTPSEPHPDKLGLTTPERAYFLTLAPTRSHL